MIASMTGMGRAKGSVGSSQIVIELKSVNHKFCEVYARLPSRFMGLDTLISSHIKKRLPRGKVDVWIGEDREEGVQQFNKQALQRYYNFLKNVKKELKLKEEITLDHLLGGQSHWMSTKTQPERQWKETKVILDHALDALIDMRRKEGKLLIQAMSKRLAVIESLFDKVSKRRKLVVDSYQERLKQRLSDLLGETEVNRDRLLSEIAILADKSDVCEELERLQAHFVRMKELMKSKEPVGRPIDFLIQELNREFNTIASKSQDATIAHTVVEAKSELEKIREQVQNIE